MNYTELSVWIQAKALTKRIYLITKSFPQEELFSLTNQIQRAAISIPSNIAEGIGRSTSKDTLHFLFIARGSLYEVETQIHISYELGYIKQSTLSKSLKHIEDCKKLLNGFINYYKSK